MLGFIKRKGAIHMTRGFFGRRKNFTLAGFWAICYHVSTIGKNEEAIRKYVKEQERADRRIDQLKLYSAGSRHL
jgi:putative transposase